VAGVTAKKTGRRLLQPRVTWDAVAIGLVCLVLVSEVAEVLLRLHESTALGRSAFGSFLALPCAAVGIVVVRRVRGNAIGWILLGLAVVAAVGCNAAAYAVIAYRHGHPGLPLARLAVFLAPWWIVLVLALPVPILLFPDGRLPGGRWRWTLWLYFSAATVLVADVIQADALAFTEHHVKVTQEGTLVASVRTSPLWSVASNVALVTVACVSVAWVLRQILSYRKSSADRRQQLKWLMSGGALCVVGLVLLVEFSGGPALRVGDLGAIGVFAMPVTIAVAILKYRLYDIDRIISRSLSYGLLTALVVGVYVGVVTLTTKVIGFSSPVAVAVSTLVAAALFNPLRRRLQHGVDRRFNRERYDAERMVSAFAARLRESVDPESVRDDLIAVVEATLAPAHSTLWLIQPKGD
jgi:hypothetical protein